MGSCLVKLLTRLGWLVAPVARLCVVLAVLQLANIDIDLRLVV